MIPIGRGQRQLIIGDRQTGKTAIARSTRSSTRRRTGSPATRRSRCAASTSRSARRARRSPRSRVLSKTPARWSTRRSSPLLPPTRLASSTSPLHRFGDRSALDVRRQARPDHLRRPVQAGRGLSCGVAAPAPPAGARGLPGRRLLPPLALLERCAKLSDELGAGSMTGLPIIETRPMTCRPTSRRTSSRSRTARSSCSPPVQRQSASRGRRRHLGVRVGG